MFSARSYLQTYRRKVRSKCSRPSIYSIAEFFRTTRTLLEYSPSGVSLHEYMVAILQRGCLPKRRLLPPFSNHRFSTNTLLRPTPEGPCHHDLIVLLNDAPVASTT